MKKIEKNTCYMYMQQRIWQKLEYKKGTKKWIY